MKQLFPHQINVLPYIAPFVLLLTVGTVLAVVTYYATPKFWEVGYMPDQPGAGFSHSIHAGKLGMDCRYCHTNVEDSTWANIPTPAKCMNCHTEGRLNADLENRFLETSNEVDENGKQISKVQHIRDAYAADKGIPWKRIHKLPDYVLFPHNVHVNAGVSCYSCHGPVNRMEVVHQDQSLSMGWCLDCHADPKPHLVPKDKVTDLVWVEKQLATKGHAGEQGGQRLGELEKAQFHRLPRNCSACHY